MFQKPEIKNSQVKAVIRGTSPFLMNNPVNIGRGNADTVVRRNRPDKDIEAEGTTYRDSNGSLYVPSTHIFGCMFNAATSLKQPGSRKALSTEMKGAYLGISDITGTPRMVTMRDYQGNPLTEIDIFSARCVIQKASVIKHRAMINEYQLEFFIKYASEYISAQGLFNALVRGGVMVGIGDYRPDKKGEYGRFEVVSFEEV